MLMQGVEVCIAAAASQPTCHQGYVHNGIQVISKPAKGWMQLLLYYEGQVALLPLSVQIAESANQQRVASVARSFLNGWHYTRLVQAQNPL